MVSRILGTLMDCWMLDADMAGEQRVETGELEAREGVEI
jgi:hypothetical protein